MGGVVSAVRKIFSHAPALVNPTLGFLQDRAAAQSREAHERQREEDRRRYEEERREEERKRNDEYQRQMDEERRKNEEHRRQMDEALKRVEEARQVSEDMLNQEKRRVAELLAQQERENEERLSQVKLAADEHQARLAEANEMLAKGIKPIRYPSMQEIKDTKAQMQYNKQLLHFAICGAAGSGKSSLINAFRGVKAKDPLAAKTGATETTLEISRYPDPRKQYPFRRFVWYDIPGAGTSKIPSWQYFIDQGLFIFDFIIVVWNDVCISIMADWNDAILT